MVRNRIKVLLAEAEITATTLVEKMPAGVDKVLFRIHFHQFRNQEKYR